MKKRITALLLLASLLCSSACGNNVDTVAETTALPDAVTTVETAAAPVDEYGRKYVSSALPDNLNFDGTTVNLWCRNDNVFVYEFAVEEEIGDMLNDAVYNRNRKVEERLNIDFNYHTVSYNFGGETAELKTPILASAGAYDIAAVHCSQGSGLVALGAYRNLFDFDVIDLDKPWWRQSLKEELSLFDYLPMISGDIALSSSMFITVVLYNQRLYNEYYTENIYDIVKSGKWTLDTLLDMTKDIHRDIDGNSTMDENDFYAMAIHSASTPLDAFIAALDMSFTTRNSDHIPELTFNNEHTVAAFEKLTQLVKNNPGTWSCSRDKASWGYEVIRSKFINGEIIFNPTNIGDTEYFRHMDDPYGVLPLPKYDENQEDYHTLSNAAYSMMTIPVDSPSPDAAAAALEALGEESWRTVTPTYYEVALKAKYFHDDESSQMFDRIIDGVKMNFDTVYQSTGLGGISELIRDLSKDFSSTYAANEKKYMSSLASLLEDLEKLNNQ